MLRPRNSPPKSHGGRRLKWALVSVAAAVTFTLTAFAVGNHAGLMSARKEKSLSAAVPYVIAGARPTTGDRYIRRGQLWPGLRDALGAIGDRLEQPGKERITLAGTVSHGGESGEFILVREFPGRLRYQEQGAPHSRVLTFNGREAWKQGASLDPSEEDLLETLVYDFTDQLFTAHAGGAYTRFLGSRYRLDGGDDPGYAGPFYDLYEIAETVRVGRETRQQTRTYYLNSDTRLLERVRYESERGGVRTQVEVVLSDWREVQGQKIPFGIARTENGTQTLLLAVTAAAAGPRVEDGLFTKTQAGQ